MNNDELKRLKRFIVISWALLLMVIVGLTFWGSYQIKNLKDVIAQRPEVIKGENGLNGIEGKNGLSVIGLQGMPGIQGLKGDAGNPGEKGEVGPQGLQGEIGPQGLTGAPGKTVFVRNNPKTQIQECRYSGDIDWQPIEDCQ